MGKSNLDEKEIKDAFCEHIVTRKETSSQGLKQRNESVQHSSPHSPCKPTHPKQASKNLLSQIQQSIRMNVNQTTKARTTKMSVDKML